LIQIARDDAEIAPLLSPRGYTAQKLAEGLRLQEAAQAAFAARQNALAAQKQTAAAGDAAEDAARAAFTDFRGVARALFSSPAERTALGLTGLVSHDAQKFITTARASYTTAQAEPYKSALASYGYPAAAIKVAAGTLDAMTTAYEAQQSAAGAALQATTDRDAAAKALDTWVRQFSQIAAVALKSKPALARKLGV
jgi:hypothetical protein